MVVKSITSSASIIFRVIIIPPHLSETVQYFQVYNTIFLLSSFIIPDPIIENYKWDWIPVLKTVSCKTRSDDRAIHITTLKHLLFF